MSPTLSFLNSFFSINCSNERGCWLRGSCFIFLQENPMRRNTSANRNHEPTTGSVTIENRSLGGFNLEKLTPFQAPFRLSSESKRGCWLTVNRPCLTPGRCGSESRQLHLISVAHFILGGRFNQDFSRPF